MGALVSNPDDTVTMKEQENIKAEKKKIWQHATHKNLNTIHSKRPVETNCRT
jgi:hypothetical protein